MKTLQESMAFDRRVASGEISPEDAIEILVKGGNIVSEARRRVSVLTGQRDGERHPHPESLPAGEGL